MPSFDFLDRVELFVRAGAFPVDATKSCKKVTRAASKNFTYKDGCLWRRYRGRLLRVVRSDEEVREVLTRYHDNNSHAGRVRTVKEIMLMYYWIGVTAAVKNWIKACPVCQNRGPVEPPDRFCLAYGCDASSYVQPELGFHRFPKEAERRRRWLAAAQRDEGSLRTTSRLCSRHFEPSCFTLSDEGQLTLSRDAVPTVAPPRPQEDELPVPSDEDFLSSNTLEDLLSTAAAAAADPPDACEAPFDGCDTPLELQEHQYCLPAPDPEPREVQTASESKRRKPLIEPGFKAYNQIASYLSHRVLPMQNKKTRGSLKRMAKRFGLIDGVLMYTRTSLPLRVPRSRQEVNSILEQFHDNQGHHGQGICQREISKHFYWASMTRDLARWISCCHTCLSRTKRKWLRCSVSSCTNCCGPVERGLGLTFHKFPLHNAPLLAQWLKAVGRSNWHPRLRSSVCSTHFAEDCFDRGGEKVALRPDAVPTLLVHGDAATPCRGPAQAAAGEEAFFAKYDAVELYLRRRVYPAGLNYVEKNTFRRFCKKFGIKDDELHMVRGDRVRLVLRSRQQVEKALTDYHNELNHLDVNKCLRLLNERCFWKTMKSDVMLWIDSCSQCSKRKRRKAEPEPHLEAPTSPQIPGGGVDSGKDNDGYSDDDDGSGGNVADEETPPGTNSEDTASSPPQAATPINPQPRIPILLHLRTPISLQPKTPIILQPRTPNAPLVAHLWSVRRPAGVPNAQPEERSAVRVQDTGGSQGGARTHRCVRAQEEPGAPGQSRGALAAHGGGGKRKGDPEEASSAKRSSSGGLEPVAAPSSKPWPVFTITASARTAEDDSSAPARRPRRLQARTVLQQCSSARVKTRPAVDGNDAQWAEIQEGLVVYVCFFHGATEDVADEMASSLMTAKVFRKDSGHSVCVLDLPGSVLLIPQDSLLGEPAAGRRIQYRGGCEPWRGAQLFSNLVSACSELMAGSGKCAKVGATVEHGVYGQKQELVLNSAEPLTLLLEF